jgi:beta-glucosidase
MPRDLTALIADLDLDEKASLLAGADLWSTAAVERVGLPSINLTDGPNGARGPDLPVGFGSGGDDTSTCLPSGAALGATWDLGLLERVGAVIGAEARAKACRVLLAPTVNLHRSPLGGRNFESYSEDPLLAGRLAAAFVRGAQAAGVACTVKHFAGNESEDGRMVVDSVVDERTLRELYLVPFEIAVCEGGALGVMTGYNRLNGRYCTSSRWLLGEVLRGDWGFEGFVVSDWFGFVDTAEAILAGLDLEMPGPGRGYGPALADAVRSGAVDERDVDAAVSRLLGVLDRIGALGEPDAPPPTPDPDAHRGVARDAAVAATVLLRNESVLPLEPAELRRVAVIGPNAARAVIMGGGSASLPVAEPRTPLEALRDRLGDAVEVVHEPGVSIARTSPEIPGDLLQSDGEPGLFVECFALDDVGGAALHTTRVTTGSVMWFGPPPGVGPEFSWRATGELRVATAGRWTLSLVETEPARLSVDGVVVLEDTTGDLPAGPDFFGMARREQTIDLELSPGRPVALAVESSVMSRSLVAGAKLGLRPALPPDGIERAVEAARGADAVVIVVGTDGDWESEGHDRESMSLPGGQDELVERVLAVAPDAVVVVNAGSVVTLPWAERCRALLQCWFGGSELAEALADVLLGDADPGGRLPTTVPARLEHNPTWGNFPAEDGRLLYGERGLVGYRWYEARHLPIAFPFGHGQSYTSFELGIPVLSSPVFEPGSTLTLSVPVTNVGDRAGSEVVQVYVAARCSKAFRPPKELKGFAKVRLRPGESTEVRVELDDRAFARWAAGDPVYAELVARQSTDAPWMPAPSDLEERGWVLDPGDHELHVGRSSADIAHRLTVEVVART